MPSNYEPTLRSMLRTVQPRDDDQIPFTLLPALCCQAVGGDRSAGVIVSGAWWLMVMSARMLDDLEDGDWYRPDENASPRPADRADAASPAFGAALPLAAAQGLNLAASLIFASTLALTRLASLNVKPDSILDLIEDFQQTALKVAAGQQLDLTAGADESLESFWKVVSLKTGEPIALACRAGAKVGGGEERHVSLLEQFGHNLGTLNQIYDDLSGVWGASDSNDLAAGKTTLPVLYALEVAPEAELGRLRDLLVRAKREPQSRAQAREMMAQFGAVHYFFLEVERCRQSAKAALLGTGLPRHNLEALFSILDQAGLLDSNSDSKTLTDAAHPS